MTVPTPVPSLINLLYDLRVEGYDFQTPEKLARQEVPQEVETLPIDLDQFFKDLGYKFFTLDVVLFMRMVL